MNSNVDLKNYLENQLSALRDLHNILQEEQKAVISLDTDRMGQLNIRKEEIQDRQQSMVAEGRRIISSVAIKMGLPADTSLSRLIERLDRSEQPELMILQKDVVEMAAQVRQAAGENSGLLERFLGTVNESIGFLLRVLNTSNQYGASGSFIPRIQSGAVMLNREA